MIGRRKRACPAGPGRLYEWEAAETFDSKPLGSQQDRIVTRLHFLARMRHSRVARGARIRRADSSPFRAGQGRLWRIALARRARRQRPSALVHDNPQTEDRLAPISSVGQAPSDGPIGMLRHDPDLEHAPDETGRRELTPLSASLWPG
jgi:hypothetical protein